MATTRIYTLQLLDNGIVLTDTDADWSECEKYADEGSDNDKSIIHLIGSHIWPDINHALETEPSTKVKLTIKIETKK